MATVDKYKIILDVQGTQAVDNLKNKIGGLGTAIAAIGFGAFIAGAFRMADAMGDIADATGLSAGYVQAFAQSLQAAGGNANDAGKVLSKFFQTFDDAVQGSDKANDALKQLGIGFKELETLTEQQALSKVLEQLGKMEAGAKRLALGVEIFGKSFASIDPTKLERILKTKDVNALNDALNKSNEIVGIMEQNYSLLQTTALATITQLVGSTDNFKLTAEGAAKVLKVFAGLMLATFSLKVVSTILEIVSAVISLAQALKKAGVAQAFLTGLTGIGLIAVAAATAAAGGAYLYLSDKIDEAAASVGAFNAEVDKDAIDKGYLASVEALQLAFKEGRIDAEGMRKEIEKLDAGRLKALGLPSRDEERKKEEEADKLRKAALQDRLQKMKDQAIAAKIVTNELKRQNDYANTLRQLDIALLDIDQERADSIRAYLAIAQDANSKILGYEEQINAERAKGKDTNKQLILDYQERIRLVQQEAAAQVKAKQEEEKRIALKKQYARVLGIIDNMNLKAQLTNDKIYEDEQRQNILLGKLTQEEADRAIDTYNKKMEYERAASDLKSQLFLATADEERQSLVNQLAQLETYYENRKDIIEAGYVFEENKRNSTAAGYKDYFESLARSVDPFVLAQQRAAAVFDNMENALDNFVRTGKFKFKDFAMSIIRDLIMIELRAKAVALFKAIGMSIFGLAGGGPATAGKPYIVGERGPELFVPKASGTVIPNGQLAGGGGGSSASASMGGPITNNYITNNISAIDAKGVAQMFAENRKTLLGTVRYAQKELSYAGTPV
jgi:lambda family phage tail tape measure protein